MRTTVSGRGVGVAAASLAIGVAATGVAEPAGATEFHGEEVGSATKRSIDVIHDHLQLEQAQRRYQRILWYFGYTQRWAPGKLVFDDGKRVSSNLHRVQLNLGGGFGTYETFGVIFGAQLDFVQFLGNMGPRNTGLQAPGQSLLFLGVVGQGFQFTIGQMQNQMAARAFPLDAQGRFLSSPDPVYRDGTPTSIRNQNDGGAFLHTLFTGYHESGAFFAVAVAHGSGPAKVSEARFNFQPLKRYLPDIAGLPTFGIARLDAAKRYYADALDAKEGRQLDGAAPATDPAGIPRRTANPYEVEIGTDDALGIGARVRVVGEVYPTALFRRADFGIVHIEELGSRFELIGAARAIGFRRHTGYDAAAEAFVLIGIPPFKQSSEKIGWPFHFGVSYSYNSPDGATFIPIPKAHVFGVQVVAGVPETSKPLVPIVKPVREKKSLGFYGEEEQ